MKKILYLFFFIFLIQAVSYNLFGQRNLYVKQLAADSIKARVDTVNFPYFFSGPFTQSRTTVAVNDTLLHEWVGQHGGGGTPIVSNPNEIIQNVGGIVQGQSDLLYDPISRNLTLGRLGISQTIRTDAISIGELNAFNDDGSTYSNVIAIGQANEFFNTNPINNSIMIGANNAMFADNGSIIQSTMIGGNNTIETTSGVNVANAATIGGVGNTISNASNTAIVGGTSISATQSETVYIPQLIMGRGTGGSLPSGVIATDSVLTYNPTTGVVGVTNQVGGGGAFWPLSGLGTLTGNVDISGAFSVDWTNITDFTLSSSGSGSEMTWLTSDGTFAIVGDNNSNVIMTDFTNFQKLARDGGGVPVYQSSESEFGIAFDLFDDPVIADRTKININPGNAIIQNIDFNINNPISTDDIIFTDRTGTPEGLKYASDYSANFVDRSIVDKAYVDAQIQTAQVILTSAQILALNTTPISLIAAAGVGTYIKITSPITAYMIFGTAAYATNTDVVVRYGSSTVIGTFPSILAQGNDAIAENIGDLNNVNTTGLFNTALMAFALTSDPITGDGELVLIFDYKIITF